MTDETIRPLLNLAEECGLRECMDAMFRGERIDVTEERAVFHIASRASKRERIVADGIDGVPEVHATLERVDAFYRQVRSGV
jgi:glucose-6-phosphate isomerase